MSKKYNLSLEEELNIYGNVEDLKNMIISLNITKYHEYIYLVKGILTYDDATLIQSICHDHLNGIDTHESFKSHVKKYGYSFLEMIQHIAKVSAILDIQD